MEAAMTEARSELPEWLAAYRNAVLEVDDTKIVRRIADAEEAIGRKLQMDGRLNSWEAQAIYDAIVALRVLWHKRVAR